MKERYNKFIEKIELLTGNQTGRHGNTENYAWRTGLQEKTDLTIELEKRYREIFGEED